VKGRLKATSYDT